MNLHEINAKVQPKANEHRLGRGPGSGWGKTAGRGMNGAQSRSGWKTKLHFEGGQMPVIRRIAKRGFNNKRFGKVFAFINLSDLNAFEDGATVTPELCLKLGLIPKVRSGLKVLGQGTLERSSLAIQAHRVSKTAREALEAKGCSIKLIPAQGDEAKSQWRDKRGQGKKTVRRKAAQKKG
ncbi:MAG: 50S ribosomal protein L15 [Planctomycetes bacterium]|nr:50S ribosomal protein L15 [Planctomycetota bacterium]